MKKFLILFLTLIILFGGGIWLFRSFFDLETPEIIIRPKIVKITPREILTPPPLQSPNGKNFQTFLSREEIIKWTNIQREKHGLSALEENEKLNAMAEAKIEEMFEKQYFAHQSPLGREVGDLADFFTYEFLNIGENLAMGNFASEKDLLEAWMASPGHRQNILNSGYQEIGAAIKKGVFEGKSTWLAVQHFGLALTYCPQPDETLKLGFEEKEKELKALEESLIELKTELQKIRPKWSELYREKSEEYNSLVEEYNNLIMESRILVSQYNLQVEDFNQCLLNLK